MTSLKYKNISGVLMVDYPNMSENDWEQASQEFLDDLPSFEQDIASTDLQNLDFVYFLEKKSLELGAFPRALSSLHSPHQTALSTRLTQEVFPLLEEATTKFYQNEDIYQKIKNLTLPNTPSLNKWHKDTVKAFEQSGCGLSVDKKNELLSIKTRITHLSLKMEEVLTSSSQQTLLLSPSEVSSLPKDFLDQFPLESHVVDKVPTLGHAFPMSTPVMEKLLLSDNPQTRQKVHESFETFKLSTPTEDIIKEIMMLRKQWASLFGKDNYAQLRLEHNMAKTPDNVYNLLHTSWSPIFQKAQQEYALLEQLAQEDNHVLQDCDLLYYRAKYQEKHFGQTLDDIVKPYFAFDKIEKLALQTASNLFDIDFVPVEAPTHYPSSQAYLVKNKIGESIGVLVTDYEIRKEKTQGAWMTNICEQTSAFSSLPVIVNVGSFYRNQGLGRQTPLSFDDATTLFHELGHGLHGLLSNVELPSHSGTNVARDFVELPSQFLENYLTSPYGLKQAGLSEEDIEKVMKLQKFGQGMDKGRYLLSSFMDMDIHTQGNEEEWLDLDIVRQKTIDNLNAPTWLTPRHELPRFLHVFGHGYESQYYSYLWAEVMEADLFSMVENNPFGDDNKARLKTLYSQGGSMDESLLYEQVRGQAFSSSPFLLRMGTEQVKKGPSP